MKTTTRKKSLPDRSMVSLRLSRATRERILALANHLSRQGDIPRRVTQTEVMERAILDLFESEGLVKPDG